MWHSPPRLGIATVPGSGLRSGAQSLPVRLRSACAGAAAGSAHLSHPFNFSSGQGKPSNAEPKDSRNSRRVPQSRVLTHRRDFCAASTSRSWAGSVLHHQWTRGGLGGYVTLGPNRCPPSMAPCIKSWNTAQAPRKSGRGQSPGEQP